MPIKIPLIGDLIGEVGGLVGKLIPDKDLKRKLQHEVDMLEDKYSERAHQEALGQMRINEAEAKHDSIFVAGWRPFIGWTCGVALAWNFVAGPMVEVISRWFGWEGAMPQLDIALLVSLVVTMLGSSGLRTYEKMKGVARKNLTPKKQTLLDEDTMTLTDESDEEDAPWNR